jgi:hypothetical protein
MRDGEGLQKGRQPPSGVSDAAARGDGMHHGRKAGESRG